MQLPTTITDTIITDFGNQLHGHLIRPGDDAYNHARAVFNRIGNPAFVVQCASTHDVSLSITFARTHGLPFAIRSGGHGLLGTATNDGGVVVDFSHMRRIHVLNKETRRVRIEPGATWGEVAEALHAHGLALTSGDTSSVGVGGLTVGGGIGWLVRKYGLTIDSLQSVEIVTADGAIQTASNTENPDLFWAIRGGGGNFGVITAFEFTAHPSPNILFGSVYYDATQQPASILKRWAEYTRQAPHELTSILSFIPQKLTRPPMIVISVCYITDNAQEGEAVVTPLFELGTRLHHELHHIPYAAALPNHGAAHFGGGKSVHATQFMAELDDAAIQVITEYFGKPNTPMLQLRTLGGAIRDFGNDATAYAHRDATILAVAMMGADPADPDTANRHLQSVWKHLAPFSTGSYLNFVSKLNEQTAEQVYPAATLARLRSIKNQYDPDNFFTGILS